MSRKLVSVITGTIPARHLLLDEAMQNLKEQTYPNLEHCISVEGADYQAMQRLEAVTARMRCTVPTRVTALPRHWSGFLAYSVSAVPFQVAQWMAAGDYLIWLADDERMTPDHIESLVDLLEATDSDFVYSKSECWFRPGLADHLAPMTIGEDPPRSGAVTNVLYRAELLDYRGFETHVGSGTDWDQVEAWMKAGARWAMLDRVTHRHRVDKLGEGPHVRMERQPLRGHR